MLQADDLAAKVIRGRRSAPAPQEIRSGQALLYHSGDNNLSASARLGLSRNGDWLRVSNRDRLLRPAGALVVERATPTPNRLVLESELHEPTGAPTFRSGEFPSPASCGIPVICGQICLASLGLSPLCRPVERRLGLVLGGYELLDLGDQFFDT